MFDKERDLVGVNIFFRGGEPVCWQEFDGHTSDDGKLFLYDYANSRISGGPLTYDVSELPFIKILCWRGAFRFIIPDAIGCKRWFSLNPVLDWMESLKARGHECLK